MIVELCAVREVSNPWCVYKATNYMYTAICKFLMYEWKLFNKFKTCYLGTALSHLAVYMNLCAIYELIWNTWCFTVV